MAAAAAAAAAGVAPRLWEEAAIALRGMQGRAAHESGSVGLHHGVGGGSGAPQARSRRTSASPRHARRATGEGGKTAGMASGCCCGE